MENGKYKLKNRQKKHRVLRTLNNETYVKLIKLIRDEK